MSYALPPGHSAADAPLAAANGRWLISYRSLTRLRVDASPDFFRFTRAL